MGSYRRRVARLAVYIITLKRSQAALGSVVS
jgi:hypothetical protein